MCLGEILPVMFQVKKKSRVTLPVSKDLKSLHFSAFSCMQYQQYSLKVCNAG